MAKFITKSALIAILALWSVNASAQSLDSILKAKITVHFSTFQSEGLRVSLIWTIATSSEFIHPQEQIWTDTICPVVKTFTFVLSGYTADDIVSMQAIVEDYPSVIDPPYSVSEVVDGYTNQIDIYY
jgi:hypothetical protein